MGRNRLAEETSPYLLQHKDNPVHWWPWGPEALAQALRAGKPILLSIGYAACHWCHVMAHESFEDAETAAVMNELFVNIKVDREERPDIDAIYMSALHSLGEHGGWPLTMFLDSAARPFWGGTYFPNRPRFSKPSFQQVLKEVGRIYRDEPSKVARNAGLILEALKPDQAANDGPDIGEAMIASLVPRLTGLFDPVHGGIRGAPKFPQVSFLNLVWRSGIRFGDQAALDAVINTLGNICQGGIYDHLGGGFARYSVDERWLVPHFEKMLYDNAQLLELMTEVWRETGSPLLKARIAETAGWVLREMVAEGGGFASSYDADSEGEEGRFYVWRLSEIEEVLGSEDARAFAAVYDATPAGNFEGHTILNRLALLTLGSEEEEARLARMRAKLLERRSHRIAPGFDDKVLADWNGLMIAALARAARIFQRGDWQQAAERAYAFVATAMTRGDRLVHSARSGQARTPGNASDYANMISAAIRLHETTGKPCYIADAQRWTAALDHHHWAASGGYATAADDTDDVIVRLCNGHDDATPNANGVMAANLVALSLLTGDLAYQERGESLVRAFSHAISRQLIGHTGLLAACFELAAPRQIVIIDGVGSMALRIALDGVSIPGALELNAAQDLMFPPGSPLFGKTAIGGKATAYVCTGPQCLPPVTTGHELAALLRQQRLCSRTVQP